MQWIEVRVTFEAPPQQAFGELMADLFAGFGVTGVVIEDPGEPVEDIQGLPPLPRPEHHAVSGYFSGGEEIVARFEGEVHALARRCGTRVAVHRRTVDEADWAESWKAFFHPERIGERLVVKPSWRDVAAGPDDLVIEIDPGMAFGTGTHPTTAMCLRLLERHLAPGDAVLDVGCGSGILMIAAAKLGAGRLAGIDLDPMAVSIAGENLRRNGVPESVFRVEAGHLIKDIQGRYDLVVANILADAVIDLIGGLEDVLKSGGLFIGSGILVDQGSEVEAAMARAGLVAVETTVEDPWLAVAARMGRPGGGRRRPPAGG